MSGTEKLLEEAGERWRQAQPGAPDIGPATFRGSRSRPAYGAWLVSGAIGATLMLATVAVVARTGFQPGGGAQRPLLPIQSVHLREASPDGAGSSQSPNASDRGERACAVTRPIPVFVPPKSFLASPPETYQSDWFGSAGLWTMINRSGESWKRSELPRQPEGLAQKTFWWSADWRPQNELQPAITVIGTRLDGPGAFAYNPGTNAGGDFGTAMLVGINFPGPGCWQLTGRYRDAVLSYVVEITDN